MNKDDNKSTKCIKKVDQKKAKKNIYIIKFLEKIYIL